MGCPRNGLMPAQAGRIKGWRGIVSLFLLPVCINVLQADVPPEAPDAGLSAAAAELAELRASIARERSGYAERHDSLLAGVRLLRRQWREAEQTAAHREAERAALQRREAAEAVAWRALRESLVEFRRASETHMSMPDRQRLAPLLREIDVALERDEQSDNRLDALDPVLRLASELALETLPARRFAGTAIDGAGKAREGTFVVLGPVAYFVCAEKRMAGAVVTSDCGGEPMILPDMPERDRRQIMRLIEDSSATVPVDVTGGRLLKLARAREPLWLRLRRGGVVMLPLLGIGLLCAVVAFYRFFALRRMQRPAVGALDRVVEDVRSGRPDSARRAAGQLPAPWRDVMMEAVDHHRADRAYLEEILQDRIASVSPRVLLHLNTLAICAAAAPLLGLLGTVTGMIHTFQLITLFGTGDARTLSGGISEALITTQVGLVIAVPTLLAHAGLSRMARGVIAGLEQAAVRFVRRLGAMEETA